MSSVSRNLTIILAASLPTAQAAAETTFYAVATGAYGVVDDLKTDNGRSVFSGVTYGSLGVGAYPTPNIRLQTEFFYYRSAIDRFEFNSLGGQNNVSLDVEGAEISGRGVSVNAQYEFLSKAKLRPFIGFGTGFAMVEIENVSATFQGATVTLPGRDETEFILQTDIGVSYYPIPEFSIAPAYRYLSIGGVRETELESDMHLFTLRGAFHF